MQFKQWWQMIICSKEYSEILFLYASTKALYLLSGGPCPAKPYKILIDIKNNSRNITSFSRDQFVKIPQPAEIQGGISKL